MAIPVNNDWHLLLSDALYEPTGTNNVPVLNKPEKKGKAVDGNNAWDSTLMLPCGIVDDPVLVNGIEYRYRMYYSCDCLQFGTSDAHCLWRKLAVVLTNDGLNWTKPILNLFNCGTQCGNSNANNILDVCPMTVWRDGHESDSSKRYKAISYGNAQHENRIWYSADGIHNWTMGPTNMFTLLADGANQIVYDDESGDYVGFFRSWWNQTQATRCAARLVGPAQYMGAWTTPPLFACSASGGNSIDASQAGGYTILHRDMQNGGYYNPAYFRYPLAARTHLFMPSMLFEDVQLLDVYLAYSRSMLGNLNTPENDPTLANAIIPRGDAVSGDQTIYAQPFVIQTAVDKESYYYSGYIGTHATGKTSGAPGFYRAEGRLRGLITRNTETSLTVTSEQLLLPAQVTKLIINAKVGTGGSIKIAICDATGNELTNFSLAKSIAFTGDSVAAEMTWIGAPDLQTLSGQTIRLKWQVQGGGANNPTKRAAFAFLYTPSSQTPNLSVSGTTLGCSENLTVEASGFSGTGNYAWSIVGIVGAGAGTTLGATSTATQTNTLIPSGIDGVGSVTVKCERGGSSANLTIPVSCDTGPVTPAPNTNYSSENPPCLAPARVLPAVNPLTTKMGIRAGDCFDTLSPAQGFPAFDTIKITSGAQALQTGYNAVPNTAQSVATPENVAAVIVCTLFGNLTGANTGDAATVDVVIDAVAYPLLSLIQPATPGQANAANIEKFFVGPGTHSVSLQAKNSAGARGTLNARLVTELRLP